MTAKSDELVEELVNACVAFGLEKEPHLVTRIEKARCALKAHVEQLEAAQRWRVVADGELPNKNDYYLARDDLGQQGMILFYDGEWNKFTNLSYITLWMPLPEPPEGA